MKRLSLSQPMIKRPKLWFSGLLLVCLLLSSCSALARSNNGSSSDGELEAQVLQIIRDNPEVILESVEAYRSRQQENTQQARQAFLLQMRDNPAEAIGDSPVTGSADEAIVLLEFSDFQCPYCAKAHETIQEFMAKYGDRVTLAYKHLPLSSIHRQALPAAKAAWAAGEQGLFWEYHAALFERQDQLSEELYEAIAEELNLDLDKFNSDRESPAAQGAIAQDLALAQQLSLNGTPVFFLNEETLTGAVELGELEAALERVSSGN